MPAKAGIVNGKVHFSPEAKSSASIIGPTCAFDVKKHKIVGRVFNVSALLILSKKNINFFHFCFQLQAVLVDFPSQQ